MHERNASEIQILNWTSPELEIKTAAWVPEVLHVTRWTGQNGADWDD